MGDYIWRYEMANTCANGIRARLHCQSNHGAKRRALSGIVSDYEEWHDGVAGGLRERLPIGAGLCWCGSAPDGFSVHANVAVSAGDRARLERLAQYCAR